MLYEVITNAHMVRRVRLAQRTRVEVVNILVRHSADAVVTMPIDSFRFLQRRLNLLWIGNDSHLHTVYDGREVVMDLRNKDIPEMS